MRALDRKLLRDLWQLKGQALAIGLVIAAGVTIFITYLSNFGSLRLTQSAFYERHRFGDVFAGMKRAPLRLAERIAEIPGVATVATRVVVDVTLDVEGLSEPATGRLISMQDGGNDPLNTVFLRRGRFPEPQREDEVVVNEGFALKHGFGPGDRVTALINGRRRALEITGIALSPEYVYGIRPGELMPDDTRFGVFWMGRRALATAYNMEGGFNDVSLRLMPGATTPEVISRLDRLIEPYGGLGSFPRALQISHWYLESELQGLQKFGSTIPIVFLAVAAFLLNVVLTRIVAVQREQIAALKALGYANRDIGLHYCKASLAIGALGAGLGTVFGAWLGSALTKLYNEFFRFPQLEYHLPPGIVVIAVAISLVGAVLGALGAVRRAVKLPPAEAMRPEPPARYRRTLLERLGLGGVLTQAARMVLRNLERRPGRALTSVIGIAFAGAMMVVGTFGLDAIDLLIDVQFNTAQRQDLTLTFVEPTSSGALNEVRRLPGVLYAEPLRAVPARLRFEQRYRNIAITGLRPDAELQRVIDSSFRPVDLPPAGLVLSTKLAEILGAEPGDVVRVEVLEGRRPIREVPISALVDEFLGTSAYMDFDALQRMLRESAALSGATLLVDPVAVGSLYELLKSIPGVAGVMLKDAALRSFQETIAQNIILMIVFNVLFSGIIAFGVVYNAARISLSERSRELASLRVLGFTRAEISAILLGELAILTLVAVPLALVLGRLMAGGMVAAFDTEVYRFPLTVSARTYSWSAITVLVSALISGLVVRRKLDRLDLIAVLKTSE